MTSDLPAGQGLAALLDYARRHSSVEDLMPLEALSTAELDEKITALTGQRGFAICLREHLEAERARRQSARARLPATLTIIAARYAADPPG